MKIPRVRMSLWEMAGLGTWLDSPPDTSDEEPNMPYTSYVVDFSTYCSVKDSSAIFKLNDLLCRSGVPEHKLKEIFQRHPNFESCPVRCRILKSSEGYDPYTAFVFLFNRKKIVIFIPWNWETHLLCMRSDPALSEAELGTFVGKTIRFLKDFPLPSAPQPHPLIRFLKCKLWPGTTR